MFVLNTSGLRCLLYLTAFSVTARKKIVRYRENLLKPIQFENSILNSRSLKSKYTIQIKNASVNIGIIKHYL